MYAILLGWSFAGKVSIRALRRQGYWKEEIRKITMLGDGRELGFVQDGTALTVTLPDEKPCETAWVLKLEI